MLRPRPPVEFLPNSETLANRAPRLLGREWLVINLYHRLCTHTPSMLPELFMHLLLTPQSISNEHVFPTVSSRSSES